MTEILLKVTNKEIYNVCTEELQRHIKKLKGIVNKSISEVVLFILYVKAKKNCKILVSLIPSLCCNEIVSRVRRELV